MIGVSFDFVPYSEELLRVYRTLLPEQASLIDAGKIAWKLRDHPVGPGAAVVCRSAVGEVVGLTAFQPARFIDGADNIILGYQSMDAAVAPKAGTPGLLLWLLRSFYERTNCPLTYGFPNDKSAQFHFG